MRALNVKLCENLHALCKCNNETYFYVFMKKMKKKHISFPRRKIKKNWLFEPTRRLLGWRFTAGLQLFPLKFFVVVEALFDNKIGWNSAAHHKTTRKKALLDWNHFKHLFTMSTWWKSIKFLIKMTFFM